MLLCLFIRVSLTRRFANFRGVYYFRGKTGFSFLSNSVLTSSFLFFFRFQVISGGFRRGAICLNFKGQVNAFLFGQILDDRCGREFK